MVAEQRVISQKIGARSTAPAPVAPERRQEPEPEAAKPPSRRGRKVVALVVGVLVVLAAAGAAFLLLGRDPGATEPPPEPEPVPGEVLAVGPVSINLANGHYLRLGLALQLTQDVEHEPDPARALDLAIALYSGRPIDEVTDPETRQQLKTQLLGQLGEAYDGEVMDLYLTDYVTQ